MGRGERFHGLEIELRAFSGARAVRVVHRGGQAIGEHRHDWPFLSLHVLGAYHEEYDGGAAWIAGPSVVLHPAGRPHADRIDAWGLETISIEFDPAWLKGAGRKIALDRSLCLTGGAAGLAARRLGALWCAGKATEAALRQATVNLIALAGSDGFEMARPDWLPVVERALAREAPCSTADLARRLDLHPAWLARAYRAATGEGMQETIRRRRVERAARLLRETAEGIAEIAAACGFCDQSHMNRTFHTVIGRTPGEIRAEAAALPR